MSREYGTHPGKVYIGNMGTSPPSTAEVEKEFGYYGKLQSVWIARRPPGFGYVEFDDERDAKDAVRDLDNKQLFGLGRRVKVELSHGRRRETRRLVNISSIYIYLTTYLLHQIYYTTAANLQKNRWASLLSYVYVTATTTPIIPRLLHHNVRLLHHRASITTL
jgi:RNA recognition motif-containing protein